MPDYTEAEHLLDTYTLQEIFELNDVDEADVLAFLITEEYIKPPSIKPLDFE